MTDTPTSVYKYVDPAERLIYVGITSRGITRQLEHNQHAEWWRFVARQDVEHFDTRPEAAARENELIRAHHPPFNTAQNDLAETVRPAYLALRAAERAYELALVGVPRTGPFGVPLGPGLWAEYDLGFSEGARWANEDLFGVVDGNCKGRTCGFPHCIESLTTCLEMNGAPVS